MQSLLEGIARSQTQSGDPVRAVERPFSTVSNLHSHWPEWITLSFYAAVVAFAIPYHEPWADEAQAWQLARTLSLHDLLFKYVRYEGSPGLWHLLLWILIRAHVSYYGLHWVCGAIAVCAASLLIFRSPFPRYLKLTLPFTFFLLFQYAVVARSYVLVPVLLFMIAIWWKGRPIRIAILLGLLANVALHASVISGGLAIVYCIAQVREGTTKKPERRRELLLGAIILLSFYAFAIWTVWPPHDFYNHISQFRGSSRSFLEWAITSLVWGICQPWILSIPFWLAIGFCLNSRRSLFYLLPVLFFSAFSGIVYVTFWHMGLLVPLVICLLWVTWPATGRDSRYETIGRTALIFLVGTQILWSAYAVTYDHSHAYSPDLAAAKFLKPLVQDGGTIAVTFLNMSNAQAYDDVGISPYFDQNIYMNQPYSFWWWSSKNQTEDMFPVALRSRPRIVLVETQVHSNHTIDLNYARIKLLTKAGYRLTNVFCGAKPERLGLEPRICHLIFQPRGNSENQPVRTND